MNYLGDYNDGFLYGTLNQNKIKVSTAEANSFLSCILNINFQGETWTHTFEVPFFDTKAELYFENFVHSLITQKFIDLNFDTESIIFHDYFLAETEVVLNETRDGEILDTETLNFYLMIGSIEPFQMDSFSSGFKKLLVTKTPAYFTKSNILTISFLSANLPSKLIVNSEEIDLPVVTTDKFLHSVSIPIKSLEIEGQHFITIKLKFQDLALLEVGNFEILSKNLEQNIIFYQNEFGSLSSLELNGYLETPKDIKAEEFRRQSYEQTELSSSLISVRESIRLNTGYIYDISMHEALEVMIKSFNIFLLRESFNRIILYGNQKLKPYKTGATNLNEDFKFKIAKNDNIYNGIF